MSQELETGSQLAELQLENERLRARLSALDEELVRVQAKANEAVAAAEDRAYWLDRWHIDLNALMLRPGAGRVRGLLRVLRAPMRLVKRLLRAVR